MKRIKPPLPFVGHKGAWGPELALVAQNIPSGCVVIDVFGGSGICAHYIKQARPDLLVVWNDLRQLPRASITRPKRKTYAAFSSTHSGRLPVKAIWLSCSMPISAHSSVKQSASLWPSAGLSISRPCRAGSISIHTRPVSWKRRAIPNFTTESPSSPLRLDACKTWLSDVVRTSVEFSGLDTSFNLFGVPVKLSDFAASRDVMLILDPPYLATCCSDYGNKEALRVLQAVCECCERLPFLLFGDVSISFWYDQLFKGRAVSKYTKDFINIGLGHKARTEVLFAALPWDHAQPLA
ncbi:MAG: hypothetical protein IJ268_01845 [Proteobacteria bacterium]|nr:hypothetical protein [Pseudomonadota bacterium]